MKGRGAEGGRGWGCGRRNVCGAGRGRGVGEGGWMHAACRAAEGGVAGGWSGGVWL